MLHLPLPLMNRHNKTESAVFKILDTVFPKDLFSDYLYRKCYIRMANIP